MPEEEGYYYRYTYRNGATNWVGPFPDRLFAFTRGMVDLTSKWKDHSETHSIVVTKFPKEKNKRGI